MSLSFRWLPADIWLGCILPRLSARDVLSLIAVNSDTRSFFTTGRLAVVLKELGFSDYLTTNEWSKFLLSLGVFLPELDIQSRVFAGINVAQRNRRDDGKDVVCNQTSKTVTLSLVQAARHPRIAVQRLSLFTPYLAGTGLRFSEVKHNNELFLSSWQRHTRFLEEEAVFPAPSAVLFEPAFAWNQLLWPSLTALRLTGPFADLGPVFSAATLRQLGQAVPALTLLELQSLPPVIDLGAWFPRLETFIVQQGTSTSMMLEKLHNVTGSVTLRSLTLLSCKVTSVLALIRTSPNLELVDLGRVVVPVVGAPLDKVTLPRSVRHLVTNGALIDLIAVDHQLENLQVFNCHECSEQHLVQLSNASIRATLHRVPRRCALGNHVAAFFVSEMGQRPEGFVKGLGPRVHWGLDPTKDHSRSRTGPLIKTLQCPACSLLIDETCISDHDLVCLKRKQQCALCKAQFASRAELERHNKVCQENVGHCHLCFKVVPRSQWCTHYERDHNDRQKIHQADCPNSASRACQFFGSEQNTAERERHLRYCKSGVFKCMSCEQDVPCRAAAKLHQCSGPRFVLAMIVNSPCRVLFPNDEAPQVRIPIEGKNRASWQCSGCEMMNEVTSETLYHLRFHCKKCFRVPKLE